MFVRLFDLETVLDDTGDTGAGGFEPAPEPAGDSGEEQPADFEPESPAALSLDDPALAELVGDLSRAQIEQILTEAQETYQPDDGGADFSDLDPFEDGFGQKLVEAMRQIVTEAVQPINTRFESQAQNEAVERGNQVIAETLDTAGITRDDARKATVDLAQSYLPQMEQRFGAGSPRAADAALQQAIKTVTALSRNEQQAGGQAEIDRLAAVAGASAQPNGGGAGVLSPERAKTPGELLARRFGLTS